MKTPVKIDVTISVTLSKTVSIKVVDYERSNTYLNEDGYYSEDLNFDNCDLKEAVKNQVTLPQEEFSDWYCDDFEVIKE